MEIHQIEKNIKKLIKKINKDIFIYDLLLAYNLPKASVTRLRKGSLNLSKNEGEIRWKKKLFFKEVSSDKLHISIDEISKDEKSLSHSPRFIVVTDYKSILAYDTKTKDSLEITIKELPKYFDFFLPWSGVEKTQYQNENPADVKAAEKMARLFDEIKKNNSSNSKEFLHSLNVFLVRLLFCLFAEDTEIFKKGQFINSLASHTKDGESLQLFFENLFKVLNESKDSRKNIPEYLNSFPHVNGGLFKDVYKIPNFTTKSRQVIIDAAQLDWSEINPDIFGSMMQAVVRSDIEDDNTKHYTSVPNIMKVIEPLFLDDLYEEFYNSKGKLKKLNKLLIRISEIVIFDPACGSGNFLIIAYKEMRKLEIKVIKELNKFSWSEIKLNNFYGIELDDFACEVAKLSLWLAEHQMNLEFKKEMGDSKPTLPLKDAGKITQGNACLLDWENVCSNENGQEIYVLGNPPYLGGKLQNSSQKNDMKIVFKGFKKYQNLDYISCWFYKASGYITEKTKVAFVTTNSICQGTQVVDLWPSILQKNIEIFFAVKDFSWSNNAKYNAGVICSIIGLRTIDRDEKHLYFEGVKKKVENINAYLVESSDIFLKKRTMPLSDLPMMRQGNIPLEQGHLRLNPSEKNEIVKNYPGSKSLFRLTLGSSELINSKEIWSLWIEDKDLKFALTIPPIRERIAKVKKFRVDGAKNAQSCANRSHQFCMTNLAKSTQLLIPIVSSIRREYIPILFTDANIITINSALVIDDPDFYIFGIINSKIHTSWVKIFAGKLKSDFRYSMGMCWYSFPFPKITQSKKDEISRTSLVIIEEREKHSEKTLRQLYDPETMPKGLKEAHKLNDLAVERCYRSKPFSNDEDRLEYLFKLYEKMVKEKN